MTAGETVMTANTALRDGSQYSPFPATMLEPWPEPEPLADALPDVAQFDLGLVPESFRPLVQDVAERMQG